MDNECMSGVYYGRNLWYFILNNLLEEWDKDVSEVFCFDGFEISIVNRKFIYSWW